MVGKPKGKKTVKKRLAAADRKDQIVKVAMSLFARNGFKGATTREIASKAGISEAVIFRHFKKKADLYRAIIDMQCGDKRGEATLIKRLDGKKGKDIFSTVASHIITEHQKDDTFLRLLTYSALERQDLSKIFIRTKALELLAFLQKEIIKLVKTGVFKRVDPALAARAFTGMTVHYSVSQELYGLKAYFKRPNKKVVDTFVNIFFDGMMIPHSTYPSPGAAFRHQPCYPARPRRRKAALGEGRVGAMRR
ncbi:MAG: TetR/AcrR family transcriptional regulator [Deltaproteobacteria bacterium]|nr:TetR/AcrR family transcriptional regulator [Deltaproteobacteria bacterium]